MNAAIWCGAVDAAVAPIHLKNESDEVFYSDLPVLF